MINIKMEGGDMDIMQFAQDYSMALSVVGVILVYFVYTKFIK